jgi:maltooligosyltrehalose trehalohydrolase
MTGDSTLRFGAIPVGRGATSFRVWAPAAGRVAVRAAGADHQLSPEEGGRFHAVLPIDAGVDYVFVLDGGRELPDPCSRWQPDGLDGPSRVLDIASFRWSDDDWNGLDLGELVVYELHVGTFTEDGTFDAVIEHLAGLRKLGVTAVELMPVATFPGDRNWGYDGVYTYAPHVAYGGPERLARLVDAAHAAGLGVILDVVYNHVGPGADFRAFGPFYTDRHSTFWGDAIDYGVAAVREWAIQNAEQWIRDYHVDGLRLDAAHAVFDDSTPHVLAELAERVHRLRPRPLVIAETETRDFRPIEEWGHDAQWADEFHHELHVLLTGEREGYYAAYTQSLAALGAQLGRRPAERLVFCSQNHDQVGNRAFGDRPAPNQLRLRAAALLFAPQTPLLFMGEEYGEQRPFRFFTDHRDPEIAEATRAGRRREFAGFSEFAGDDLPDPQDERTFLDSKLDRSTANEELRSLYRRLLELRRSLPSGVDVDANDASRLLSLRRGDVELELNFSARSQDGVQPLDVRVSARRAGGPRA